MSVSNQKNRNSLALVIAFLPLVLDGQEPIARATSGGPTFEVVSIRPVPPNGPMVHHSQDFTPIQPGGQYIDSSAMLIFMISFAYEVRNPANQLVGLPAWAKSQSFSVAAKPSPDFPASLSTAENLDQVRAMMRKMLEDRFQLRLHTEKREETVFSLTAVKGGIRLQEVDPPTAPATAGRVNAAMGDAGGRLIGKKATMAGMAASLAIFLKRAVVDDTGSQAHYDFDLRWTSPDSPDKQPSGGLGSDGISLLISFLKSNCGLQLSTRKGLVDYWVVDRIEPPSEN